MQSYVGNVAPAQMGACARVRRPRSACSYYLAPHRNQNCFQRSCGMASMEARHHIAAGHAPPLPTPLPTARQVSKCPIPATNLPHGHRRKYELPDRVKAVCKQSLHALRTISGRTGLSRLHFGGAGRGNLTDSHFTRLNDCQNHFRSHPTDATDCKRLPAKPRLGFSTGAKAPTQSLWLRREHGR